MRPCKSVEVGAGFHHNQTAPEFDGSCINTTSSVHPSAIAVLTTAPHSRSEFDWADLNDASEKNALQELCSDFSNLSGQRAAEPLNGD